MPAGAFLVGMTSAEPFWGGPRAGGLHTGQMTDRVPSWTELVVLMVVGTGPDESMSGVVHVRDVRELSDPTDEEPDADLPGIGPVAIRDSRHRVYKHGELERREKLDGKPFAIFGADTRWIWLDGADIPTAFPRATSSWGMDDYAVVERPTTQAFEGDDFARPRGPIEPTVFLGRPAWSVELAPPRHKPFPLTRIIDAQTGIVLQQRNDGFGSVCEWIEIAFGTQLPDTLFRWDGEVLAPPDREAEHEQEMARRRQWLADRGIGDIRLDVPVELGLALFEDDGAFHANVTVWLSGSLVRRRRSAQPWDTRCHYPHEYRWSDNDWDWYLGTHHGELTPEQLRSIRRQLGGTPE